MADVAETPVVEEVKNGAKEGAEAEVVAGVEEVSAKKVDTPAEAAGEKDTAAEKADADAENDDGDDDADLTKQERAIIRQVEYYFGDANLRRDKFLLDQISKDTDGWVPLSVLLTFKRLAALSTDVNEIVDALMKSDEGLLEISEDREKLRRHPERPIPEHNEELRKEIMSRTAYAKGFPLETDMSELIEFFSPYEKVLHITMRKYLDKPSKSYKFKGSVFVTFAKKEQAQEFVEKEKVLFKERELIRKWQDKYLEDKKEEMKAKSKKSKGKAAAEEEKIVLPKGTVLFFENCTDTVTREMLREAIEKIEGDWEIAYIDYSKGEKNGYIRFQEENSAAPFLEKLEEKKLKLNDDIVLTLRVLDEEEEKTYLAKAIEQMKNRRSQHNKHKGGHGHGHGNRKRRGGNDNRTEEKKKKTDDE